MRSARITLEGINTVYYISNEIKIHLADLSKQEQRVLAEYIQDSAKFCSLDILFYAVHARGFLAMVRVTKPRPLKDDELIALTNDYYIGRKDKIFTETLKNKSAGKHQEMLGWLKKKLFNITEYIKMVTPYFTQYYNKKNSRSGFLWRQRFRSYVIENKKELFPDILAYIYTRPVYRGYIKSIDDFYYTTWNEAVKGEQKSQKIFQEITGDSSWNLVEEKFNVLFEEWENIYRKPSFGTIDAELIKEALEKNKISEEKKQYHEEVWKKMYQRLCQYKKDTNEFRFPYGGREYQDLKRWCSDQRGKKRRKSLGSKRINALDKINFPWVLTPIYKGNKRQHGCLPSRKWMKCYQILKEYGMKYNNYKGVYKVVELRSFLTLIRGAKRSGGSDIIKEKLLQEINFPFDERVK